MRTKKNSLFVIEQDEPSGPCRLKCAICGEMLFDPIKDEEVPDWLVSAGAEAHFALEHEIWLEDTQE